jgi:transposase
MASRKQEPRHPHRNARTNFESRRQMVQRVQAGEPAGRVAADLGVSRRTVYKWLRRYQKGGEEALHNDSSRPKCLGVPPGA